ncbi:NUDIX domain-containing protein [Paenibacillus sp. LMG 31456]|uniref:NUDIX domain-containing protein n=1 Tax=Paenibacillus foliorum TaxID=2654974 RepID=A0A972GSY8_9BACL|nr:NUDIX domain-containing protein [Paenibacillus foliorum]NOU93287.1 NUDIX domain-containing protein [Paenibacillus foliorum]
MRTVVTGGAVIRDKQGRILFQKRSDYGNWGLPGGAMEAGESVEETMKREVLEETGLTVIENELYTVYSGSRMKYRYPDGNEVVFVMFIFNAQADLEGRLDEDGKTLLFSDVNRESLKLEFIHIEEIEIDNISSVQRPVIEDLKKNVTSIIRT